MAFTRLTFAVLFVALVLQSCTSGKKAYERGDYYQAVMKSVDRLRKSPDHKKSKDALKKSYPQAVNFYIDKAKSAEASNDPYRYERVFDNYVLLNNMYREIQRAPGALSVMPKPLNYSAEEAKYRRLAAEARYNMGKNALKIKSREGAKEAYYHFDKAEWFEKGYKDAAALRANAKEIATLRVLVDQIAVPSWRYQVSINFFQDKVDAFFFNYKQNEFVRFYPPNDQNVEYPDQILLVQFDDFVVGQTKYFEKTYEITRDSVVINEVETRRGLKEKVYGTVKATFTNMRREVSSKGTVSLIIMDGKNEAVLRRERFTGEYVWISEWGNFKGDERALNDDELKKSKLKPVSPPPPQDMFVQFCKPIYDQLTSYATNYYRQF